MQLGTQLKLGKIQLIVLGTHIQLQKLSSYSRMELGQDSMIGIQLGQSQLLLGKEIGQFQRQLLGIKETGQIQPMQLGNQQLPGLLQVMQEPILLGDQQLLAMPPGAMELQLRLGILQP